MTLPLKIGFDISIKLLDLLIEIQPSNILQFADFELVTVENFRCTFGPVIFIKLPDRQDFYRLRSGVPAHFDDCNQIVPDFLHFLFFRNFLSRTIVSKGWQSKTFWKHNRITVKKVPIKWISNTKNHLRLFNHNI